MAKLNKTQLKALNKQNITQNGPSDSITASEIREFNEAVLDSYVHLDELKTTYEAYPNTNAFTDYDKARIAASLQPGEVDADDINDSTTTNKFVTAAEKISIATALQPSDITEWDYSTAYNLDDIVYLALELGSVALFQATENVAIETDIFSSSWRAISFPKDGSPIVMYSSDTAYPGGTITYYSGSLYLATNDVATDDYPTSSGTVWQPLMKSANVDAVSDRGNWIIEASYNTHDWVLYNGKYYGAKTYIAPNGDTPDINSDWDFLFNKIDDQSMSPTSVGAFTGVLNMSNFFGTYFSDYVLATSGTITFSIGGGATLFGTDYMQVVSDGTTPFAVEANTNSIFDHQYGVPVDYILDAGTYEFYMMKNPTGATISIPALT